MAEEIHDIIKKIDVNAMMMKNFFRVPLWNSFFYRKTENRRKMENIVLNVKKSLKQDFRK